MKDFEKDYLINARKEMELYNNLSRLFEMINDIKSYLVNDDGEVIDRYSTFSLEAWREIEERIAKEFKL